jgi:hypothetical protein
MVSSPLISANKIYDDAISILSVYFASSLFLWVREIVVTFFGPTDKPSVRQFFNFCLQWSVTALLWSEKPREKCTGCGVRLKFQASLCEKSESGLY